MPKNSEVPINDLRRTGGGLIDRVHYAKERVIVTKNGKPFAAIVSIDDLAQLEGCVKYDPADTIAIKPENIGRSFDDFLREEGIYDEVSTATRKRVAQWLTNRKKGITHALTLDTVLRLCCV